MNNKETCSKSRFAKNRTEKAFPKHGDCSSEEERLAVNQEVEISKFSFHPE